jgi:Mn-dependent DtxR family transcriptional regulator
MPVTHESAEDYLERILILEEERGNKEIRAVDIAKSFSYSKPSVSIAMKKLENGGYVELGPKQQLILTAKGREIAEKMYERHKILSKIFIDLGVDPETALRDACKIEHDLSEETFEAIKKKFAK